MFTDDDDDDDGEELPPEVKERLERETNEVIARTGPSLDEALERVGFYADRRVLLFDTDGPKPVVALHGTLGKVAFSDRVQRPGQHTIDEAFAGIAEGTIDDEFAAARRELEERLREHGASPASRGDETGRDEGEAEGPDER